MSSIDAAPDRSGTARPTSPWTAVLGLALLWGAFLGIAYFAVLLTLWFFATLDEPGAAVAVDPISLVLSALPVLALLVVLVLATLRRRWARWLAVVTGVGAGILSFIVLFGLTGSPAPETVAMASAALAGAVLLALPSSSSYFRRRAD